MGDPQSGLVGMGMDVWDDDVIIRSNHSKPPPKDAKTTLLDVISGERKSVGTGRKEGRKEPTEYLSILISPEIERIRRLRGKDGWLNGWKNPSVRGKWYEHLLKLVTYLLKCCFFCRCENSNFTYKLESIERAINNWSSILLTSWVLLIRFLVITVNFLLTEM